MTSPDSRFVIPRLHALGFGGDWNPEQWTPDVWDEDLALMREAGVPYSCLAIVTNLGTGISEVPVDHSAVVDVMSDVGPRVLNLLREATTYLAR